MYSSLKKTINQLQEKRGATLIEFAIVALLFFTLIFGIAEFGILLFNQQVITNAAREGARHGIVARPEEYKIDEDAVEQVVKDFAENHIVSFGDKNFSVEASFDSGSSYCESFRDELTVDITYNYSFLFFPFADKTLGTKCVMVCE